MMERGILSCVVLIAAAGCSTGENTVHGTDGGHGDVVADTLVTDASDAASELDATDATVDARDADVGDDAVGDAADVRDGSDGSDATVHDASDACVPVTEVCNGRDDDCDGTVDESGCPGHVLINEIVALPNDAEYVEIYNPTDSAVDLSNVYLTDWHRYAESIEQTAAPSPGATDFVARFPAGTSIASHAYQTVALGNPSAWSGDYAGACPTYYLQPTATLGPCTASQPMRALPSPAAPSIGTTASLTNTGEPVTLFLWNGTSDLVADVDQVYYGAPTPGDPVVDKSMVSVDGPDPDTVTTGYRLDTSAASQQQAPVHALSAASVRCDAHEGTETLYGGNGLEGHNETSENLATTWRVTTPTAGPDAGHVTLYAATPNAANTGCP